MMALSLSLLLAAPVARAVLPTRHAPARSGSPLAGLPALPKVHHSTAIEPINASDPTMLHYARITHSIGLTVYWADKQMVFAAAAACHAADALQPVPVPGAAAGISLPRCGIAANYNPW